MEHYKSTAEEVFKLVIFFITVIVAPNELVKSMEWIIHIFYIHSKKTYGLIMQYAFIHKYMYNIQLNYNRFYT